MADTSRIEWTDATWNPVRGCTRVSSGCGGPGRAGGCYAEVMAARFSKPGQWGHGFASMMKRPDGSTAYRWTGKVALIESQLDLPLRWKKPRRIFVNSTSDLFHEALPDEAIDRVFAVMALCPQHVFQVLTKRPERMRAYMSDPATPHRIARAVDALSVALEASKEPERTVPVPGYEGYFVSNSGVIYTSSGASQCRQCGKPLSGKARQQYCSTKCKSLAHYYRSTGRPVAEPRPILTPMSADISADGHHRVTLRRDGMPVRELVHRLVLTAFVRPPRPGEEARHRDANPGNNTVSNLLWGDQTENRDDSRRHGSFQRYQKLTYEQAMEIRRRHEAGETGEALAREFEVSATQVRNIASGQQWAVDSPIEWPMRHCWLGTSVEDQATADARIPHLLETPAAIRFASYEPALGPVSFSGVSQDGQRCWNWLTGESGVMHREDGPDFDAGPKLDWIIAGGESGPGARPMHPDWARSLRDQCAAAGVAYFFKQWGEWAPCVGAVDGWDIDDDPEISRFDHRDWQGDHWGEPYRPMWCDDREPDTVSRIGKKQAGALLDGREHRAFPTGRDASQIWPGGSDDARP